MDSGAEFYCSEDNYFDLSALQDNFEKSGIQRSNYFQEIKHVVDGRYKILEELTKSVDSLRESISINLHKIVCFTLIKPSISQNS